jgi:4a-hydroxytetrahydrobiopterin dehydratase
LSIPNQQSNVLSNYLDDWEFFHETGVDKIRKKFEIIGYENILEAVQSIGQLAQEYNHHPEMLVEYKYLTVTWWSHDINGLSSRDYCCAGGVDLVLSDKNYYNKIYKCPREKYIPGENKKPSEHMQFFHSLYEGDPLNESNYLKHDGFLYGIDLFNHGYFWETHEVFELLWNQVGKKNKIANVLQSVIFFAAALLKCNSKQLKSANKHFESAKRVWPKDKEEVFGINTIGYFKHIEETQSTYKNVNKITVQ